MNTPASFIDTEIKLLVLLVMCLPAYLLIL